MKLSKLMIAVWFMDDGFNEGNRCKLSTNSFSKTDVLNLVNQLKAIGIIHCGLYESEINQFVIIIYKKSYLKFINMITENLPDIPECMKYKIDTSRYKKIDPPRFTIISYLKKQNKWQSLIVIKKQVIDLGNYDNKNDAININIQAKKMLDNGEINAEKYKKLRVENYRNIENRDGLKLIYFGNNETIGIHYLNDRKKWLATISLNNRTINLGRFTNKNDAILVRKMADELKKSGEQDINKYKLLKDKITST